MVECAVCPRTTEDVAKSKHGVADLEVCRSFLDAELGLRTGATGISSISVA